MMCRSLFGRIWGIFYRLALTAAMRRLVVTLNAILRAGIPWLATESPA